jgi:hypothetical protein
MLLRALTSSCRSLLRRPSLVLLPRQLSAMSASTNAHYRLPKVANEPNKNYAPGSPERKALADALAEMEAAAPFEVPAFVGGKAVRPLPLFFSASDEADGLATNRFSLDPSAPPSLCPTTTRRPSPPSLPRLPSSPRRPLRPLSVLSPSGRLCLSTTVPPSSSAYAPFPLFLAIFERKLTLSPFS